jgi:hypothetical protein
LIVGARVKLSGITPADIRPEGVGLPYISGTGFVVYIGISLEIIK